LNHIKKALEETNNNLSDAKIWLKKKGFKDAENKMSRSANTKLFGLKSKDNQVFLSEISCETDFVSGTDVFKNYLNITLDTFLDNVDLDIQELDKVKVINNGYDKCFDNMTLLEGLKILISKVGENCKIESLKKYGYPDASRYINGTYVHSSPINRPDLGLKAGIVILEYENKLNALPPVQIQKYREFAEKLAMQVVASIPKYLDKSEVPRDIIEQEEKIIRDGIINENKITNPESIEKVVKSKLNGWFEEKVLNEQKFVIIEHDSDDTNMKVGNLVSKFGKDSGLESLKIKEFKLFQ
jgi:elongation factor Ts